MADLSGLFQPARDAWAFAGSKQCFSKSRITLLGPPLHYVRVEPVGLFQPARNAWAFTGSKQCFSKSRITLLGPPFISCPFWPHRCQKNRTPPPCHTWFRRPEHHLRHCLFSRGRARGSRVREFTVQSAGKPLNNRWHRILCASVREWMEKICEGADTSAISR